MPQRAAMLGRLLLSHRPAKNPMGATTPHPAARLVSGPMHAGDAWS